MLKLLLNLFNWVLGIWNNLPDSTKEKIIDIIVETFESIFRSYYHSEKEKEKEKDV